jgi:hypothetical protein
VPSSWVTFGVHQSRVIPSEVLQFSQWQSQPLGKVAMVEEADMQPARSKSFALAALDAETTKRVELIDLAKQQLDEESKTARANYDNARKLVDGQAMYTCACNDRGTILDDLIVYRRAQDDWLVVCNASNRDKMSAHFARAAKDHCDFEDQTDATALIALQGPRAFEVLAALGGEAGRLSELKSFHFRDATVASVRLLTGSKGVNAI